MLLRRFQIVLCLSMAMLAGPWSAVAQEESNAGEGPSEAAAAAETSSHDPGRPVPVPEASGEAVQYYESGIILWLASTAWGVVVPLVILFTGFSATIRDWAKRFVRLDEGEHQRRRRFRVVALYLLILGAITTLLDFPLAFYGGFLRPHAYDLSNETLANWFRDFSISLTVSAIVSIPVVWILYALLDRFPRRWWIFFGAGALPFIVLVVLVTPIWIDPLYNDFTDMKDKELEARILALADRAGIEAERVYEVNKSEDTETINAYVTGFMDTKRIVLWDTAIEKLSERQLLFVMGHEMGHYALGHVYRLILISWILTFASFYVVHLTMRGIIARFRERFGFSEVSDVASLPLITVVVQIFTLVTVPLILGYSRHIEHEADRFGLELTRYNHAAASAFAKMQDTNLAVPRPWTIDKYLRHGHPPLAERIEFMNNYRPWETGDELVYGEYFEGGGEKAESSGENGP